MNEEKLVTLAINGDFEAFEQLIELYTRPLSRFVTRILVDEEDARDAIQQILLQVFQNLPTLQNPTFFRPWLFKVARNKCFEILRRPTAKTFSSNLSVDEQELTFSGNSYGSDSDSDKLESVPDPGPLPLDLIERQETREMLQEAINQLPLRSRQIVTLRYTTDLTFSEIAQALDTNENTVKTLFQRGKAQLRSYLKQNQSHQ